MKKDLKYNKKTSSVVLCCGSKKCPEVYPKGKDKVQIRDDDGFVITITREQADMIPQALEVITEKEQELE